MMNIFTRLLDCNALSSGKPTLRFGSLTFYLSKFCHRCSTLKTFDQFNKASRGKYNLQAKCRFCQSEYSKLKHSEYYKRKKEKLAADPEYRKGHLEGKRKYNSKVKEKHLQYCREWNKRNPDKRHDQYLRYKSKHPEKVKESSRLSSIKRKEKGKAYYQKNKKYFQAKAQKRQNERMKTDVQYKLTCSLRRRLNTALKLKGARKSKRTFELLGCTPSDLKLHLESQFKLGMTWENYGRDGWHIDHIIPCASFNLKDEFQQKVCFHWTNLQPMWAKENICKSDKVEDGAQPNLPI